MSDPDCNGCRRSVGMHVPEREVLRLLAEYLASHPAEVLADDHRSAERLAECRACPDLRFSGTTCRHCGCLVAVRAKLANKACPAPSPKWLAIT